MGWLVLLIFQFQSIFRMVGINLKTNLNEGKNNSKKEEEK
jgi:hypothetical protein